MSLPLTAIDRLFARLLATYGTQWTRLWDGVDPNAVKSSWAHELSGFDGRLTAVAWALENLPVKCPNVIEFRNLCRQAPMPETKMLPEPKADPERIRAELAKLAPLMRRPAPQIDGRDWARRILQKHEAKARNYSPYTISLARSVMSRNVEVEAS